MNAPDSASRIDRLALASALFGLAASYAWWFRDDPHRAAALILFALPPLLLGVGALARRRTARFWAGVFALCWFSHGVMVAWSDAADRIPALVVVALALVVVFSANASGLRARFGGKASRRDP